MIQREQKVFYSYKSWSAYVRKHMPLAPLEEKPMELILNNNKGKIAIWDNAKDTGYVFESRSNERLIHEQQILNRSGEI